MATCPKCGRFAGFNVAEHEVCPVDPNQPQLMPLDQTAPAGLSLSPETIDELVLRFTPVIKNAAWTAGLASTVFLLLLGLLYGLISLIAHS